MTKGAFAGLVALRPAAKPGRPVAYIDVVEGQEAAVTGSDAANDDLALPRWLVRQVGFAEGISHAVDVCCPECRAQVLEVAKEQMALW